MIMKLLIALRLARKPLISKQDAFEIAKKHCENNGLTWKGPIAISSGRYEYSVWTNSGTIGDNYNIHIDNVSGEVVRIWGPNPG